MLKYQEIAREIEKKIKTENLKQGTKLPSVGELVAQYKVSKNTILRTLKELEVKGAIYQVQGSGIFVRRRNRKGYITLLEHKGFSGDLDYLEVESKVINFEIVAATEEIANNLQCEIGDKVYLVKRIQSIQGQILSVEESYYKKRLITFLNRSIIEGSIFQYLEEGLNIHVGFSDKYLSVHKTKGQISKYLGLPENSPMLLVEEIYYTNNGEPFDFSKLYYHYEHSQFFLQS
ncbi:MULTISPECIES: GntR family transcriptional regulator [unclassified Enterococcus]|uniref:GntR family transcriptional regulator n=1 Tax=unclassified Enterococcus TaxID=2608891 RepID=UPI0015532695|nr:MULTISPECIES: GntR family transcriptional regulator [unclassified Enterococcus]MBS7576066.1 GntR family transcriptional regulator [Enterococcus sp. MMGLQ5-2]MBS7583299.1 GntR family transcriptional regulator [Enterococcus sp. MMGLQ5-1]NPD11159.1 GntR family transcriptional regulator [Enterococcus sp. MMGLQ5-1]NPD35902.1 GntR family transcriptional regulator [Enterococcus sp. MMGLQ5-2]